MGSVLMVHVEGGDGDGFPVPRALECAFGDAALLRSLPDGPEQQFLRSLKQPSNEHDGWFDRATVLSALEQIELFVERCREDSELSLLGFVYADMVSMTDDSGDIVWEARVRTNYPLAGKAYNDGLLDPHRSADPWWTIQHAAGYRADGVARRLGCAIEADAPLKRLGHPARGEGLYDLLEDRFEPASKDLFIKRCTPVDDPRWVSIKAAVKAAKSARLELQES
ncbi:MAG: hypothetical protein ACI9KE_004600 [Polyangiales bacterium]|jgi:hypothetical protein